MNLLQFDSQLVPLLQGYSVEYSQFEGGDFGALERVELDGFSKLATVEFWSRGWIGVDIYDCLIDEQLMNVLLSPDDAELEVDVFQRFISILKQEV